MKKRTLKKGILFLLIIAVLTSYLHWYTRDFIDQIIYDIVFSNAYISSKKDIDNALGSWEQIKGTALPKALKSYSLLDKEEYKNTLASSRYYVLLKKDVYRKVVGHVRVKDLMTRDKYYQRSFLFSSDTLYWGIDKRILYKVLALQDALEKQGYDRDAFWIRYGHRHPQYNLKVGGASRSRHLRGDAVDLVIKDINQDGRYTKKDKDIVLDLCEKQIIGKQGGIGRYPWSRTVHIDVRGKRARWDSY